METERNKETPLPPTYTHVGPQLRQLEAEAWKRGIVNVVSSVRQSESSQSLVKEDGYVGKKKRRKPI